MIAFLILVSSFIFGEPEQEFFEGVLTYKVTIEGNNEEMLKEVMPHTYSLYFGSENFRFDLDGGMMPEFMGDIITFNKVNKSYIIKEETNTAYVIENDEENDSEDTSYVIVPLKEKLVIKDFTCNGYEIVFNEPGDGLVKQRLWLTTDLNVNLPKGNNHGIGAFFKRELEGFALMIENYFESDIGAYKIIITLDQIEKTHLPKSLFSIPDHFKIKVLD